MESRPALFVAGDERIFFPALVALESIKSNNPDAFDCYICFDGEKLTDQMRSALEYHQIDFIDSNLLGVNEKIADLPKMSEGRWPIEILLNWALPEYLYGRGYQYSIKVDYDILCIKKYELVDVLPKYAIARGLVFDINIEKEGVSKSVVAQALQAGLYKEGVRAYVNAGFVAFNNQLCRAEGFFDRLLETYFFISSQSPKAKLVEQLAVFFTFTTLHGGVEELDSLYNHRVRWGVLVDEECHLTAKNIHYITSIKPWSPFDRFAIRSFVNARQGVLFSYRAIWLESASKSPWFQVFCNEKPMSQEQTLGMNIIIMHNYNQRILELEGKLKEIQKLSQL
jgi:lipopolysaccharide biosynthesis glycosyltransferase